jgi:hypothetical protein
MCEQEINEMVELSFDVLAKALDQIIFECCSDA